MSLANPDLRPSLSETDALRARWLELMRRRLPDAARLRPDWPISRDHCFGRVILDTICARPWREVVKAPAWRHLDESQLRRAVELGEALLRDEADLTALNRASLAMRGKTHVPRD